MTKERDTAMEQYFMIVQLLYFKILQRKIRENTPQDLSMVESYPLKEINMKQVR